MKSLSLTSRKLLSRSAFADITLLLFLFAGGLVGVSEAQSSQNLRESEFEVKRREEASKNLPEISFTIRLAGNKTQFRQGEVIPLELSFASSREKTYTLDAATYDRSGRLGMDKFHIEPESGFSDPLYDHFHRNGGFIGGGGRGIPDLEKKPYLIKYEINEWFRFDRPGKYSLYLTSPRVSRIANRMEDDQIILTSNAVEFEIVPAEKEWQEAELRRIIMVLDGKEKNPDRRAACRALRFLGSRAAANELVRRYDSTDNECDFEYYAGLIGSPHRDLVMQLLESQIAAPDQPVSGGWLHLMIILSLASGGQGLQEPAASADERQWGEYWERYRDLYKLLQARYSALLAQSLPVKSGKARAISANTLLGLKWNGAKLPEAASFFKDLPPEQQRSLLEYNWKRIAGDSMLPVLRKFYHKLPDGNGAENYEVSQNNTLALKRIYELAPQEGRQLIIAEMRRSNPSVNPQALTILPDETLPELDTVFVENFRKGFRTETHSALIERYGSPNIYAGVRELLEGKIGKMACVEQAALLAYCLRIEPSTGIELIRQASSAREADDSKCYTTLFQSVGKNRSSEELEKLAIEFLDDADPEVVIDAVMLLGEHGSAAAEEALWRRFEKWHREWLGREQELKTNYRYDSPERQEARLEGALRIALSIAPAWLADPKKLERLKALCVTQEERKQVDNTLQEWSGGIAIRFSPAENEWGYAQLVQYDIKSLAALKEKLDQFPGGTVFKWAPYNQGDLDEEKEKLFRELETFLGERGDRLVR